MHLPRFLVVLALCCFTLESNAAELAIPLPGGKPSQPEFQLAAKRALFSRNYEIWSVGPDIVVGKYKKRVEIAVILTDSSVILRNVNDVGATQTVNKYLLNLRRDLTYELANYALVPATRGNTAELQALVASAQTVAPEPSDTGVQYVISGRYQSQITATGHYAFKRPSHRNLIVSFRQDGNEITGVADSVNLVVSGTIEGDEIRFRTEPSDVSSYELKGTWKISPDGRRLTGRWSYSHGDGDWNLSKI